MFLLRFLVLFAAFFIDKFMKSAIMRAYAEKSRSTRSADRRERAVLIADRKL